MTNVLVAGRQFLSRHSGKLVAGVILMSLAAAVVFYPPLRTRSQAVWDRLLTQAGIQAPPVAEETVYWCPMHPSVKRRDPNQTCPVCNMALVPLEQDDQAEQSPHELRLTARQVQQSGVATRPVVRKKLYREIDTTGRLTYDERRQARITSWVRGPSRLEKLHIDFTGMRVQEGEVMAELYSPELISAQREFLIALNSKTKMPGNGLLAAARQNLLDQGLRPSQIETLRETKEPWDRIPIHAPLSGTVVKKHVERGDYVEEGERLFQVADLTTLWLYADVYEHELASVEEAQSAEITVDALPGERFEGEVAFIDPTVQPETRTVRVRIDIENNDRRLKPGMFARVRLHRQLARVVAVPESAVLHSGQRRVVLVKQSEGTFQPREVRLGRQWLYPSETDYRPGGGLPFGAEHMRYHEVLAGLAPGEQVVSQGTFLLNAESQFQSVLTKTLPPESRSATLEEAVGKPLAKRIRTTLDAYYPLSRSLAEDNLEIIPETGGRFAEAAEQLQQQAAKENIADLAAEAGRLAEIGRRLKTDSPEDLHAARVAFGRISKTMLDLLAKHGGQALLGEELFVFHCGMAKVGYQNWLWWSSEIVNPYMGQKMLRCGTRMASLAKSKE